MPKLQVSGAYSGVATFKTAANVQTSQYDALILQHLLAASRDIERMLFRRFYPVVATNEYRWPPFHVAPSWAIWTEDDLLSVTSLQVAASGINAVPVTLTNYFLEPQQHGPPYNRVEVDLSSADVFQAGTTPQRSVQITGLWGYCADTVTVGALTGAMGASDTTIMSNNSAGIELGDVLLIDSEAIFVDATPGSGAQILRRGVNGTTAVSHLNGATVSKYVAPHGIQRVVRADAMISFSQDQASWGRTIGAGELAVEAQGKHLDTLIATIVDEYQRTRVAAI